MATSSTGCDRRGFDIRASNCTRHKHITRDVLFDQGQSQVARNLARVKANVRDQVDAEGIAERHRRSFMENALAEYVNMAKAGVNLVEADWSKVRGLEFREALGQRDELAGRLRSITVDEEDFDALVSLGADRVMSPR